VPAAAKGWLVADGGRKGNGRGVSSPNWYFRAHPEGSILAWAKTVGGVRMRRAGWAAFGLILLSGAAFASAGGSIDDESSLLQRGIERFQANDCRGAIKALKEVVDAPAFGQLNDRQQFMAARVLAACAYDTEDFPTAVRASRMATAAPFADQNDWYMRLLASLVGKDKEDAGATLEKLAVNWPDALHDLKLQSIYRTIDGIAGTPEGDARNLRILKALFAANWRPGVEPPEYADGLWQHLARYALEAGDVALARKVLVAIVLPDVIIDIRAAKLYDDIVAAAPERFDILNAHIATVERLKTRIAKQPDKLEPVVQLAAMLYQLDRQDEALALLEDTLARIKAGRKYADADDQLNWLHNERSHVLMALGRVDEALTAMKAGSHFGEGGFNVSQMINLADTYYGLSRPQEALTTLAGFDPRHASPFGVMAAEEARGCAYAQLNDKANLDKSLAFARAHADDAPAVAVQLLLCAGLEDEAAALTVKYLGDKQKRDTMLESLHVGREAAKGAVQPFDKVLRQRRIALGKRPDIIKAVETFGHILDLPIVR
jgi:hypothetical protein